MDGAAFLTVMDVAILALHCVARDPRRRPNMSTVVASLTPLVAKWHPQVSNTLLDYTPLSPLQYHSLSVRHCCVLTVLEWTVLHCAMMECSVLWCCWREGGSSQRPQETLSCRILILSSSSLLPGGRRPIMSRRRTVRKGGPAWRRKWRSGKRRRSTRGSPISPSWTTTLKGASCTLPRHTRMGHEARTASQPWLSRTP